MRSYPGKIEPMKPRPNDEHGLLRLLGMNRYLSQYMSNESRITAPLPVATEEWHGIMTTMLSWSRYRRRLHVIRYGPSTMIASQPPSMQMHPSLNLGRRRGLIQQHWPVTFASRALTNTCIAHFDHLNHFCQSSPLLSAERSPVLSIISTTYVATDDVTTFVNQARPLLSTVIQLY